jgi:hypothetical protein
MSFTKSNLFKKFAQRNYICLCPEWEVIIMLLNSSLNVLLWFFRVLNVKFLNLIFHIVNIGTWFPCCFIDVITLPMNKVKLVSPHKFRIKNFFNFLFFIAKDFHRRWGLWSSKNEWILVRFKKKNMKYKMYFCRI